MSLAPSGRARLIRSGFVLLASLAVAITTQATTAQPARAGLGDLGCLPSNDYPDYSIAVTGPTATGPAQPINHPVTLTLVGSGGQVFVGKSSCPGADYDVTVQWSTLGTEQSQPNSVVVGSDTVGPKVYQATLTIHETGTGIFTGFSSTVIHTTVSTTVAYFGVAPTGTAVSAPSVATVGQPVQLSATTTNENPVAGWSWDFGDGAPVATGSDATVPHTYLARGPYDVTATVTDSLGLTDSATAHVDVYDPLVAAFTTTPGSVGLMATVHVDSAGSGTDQDTTITGFSWDFGDGGTGTGATATHAYATTGTYTITETVTDSVGRTATATHDVTVTDPPADVPAPPADAPPVASFATTTTHPTAASPVSFDGTGSTDGDGSIVDYTWNFGDQHSGSGATPQHVYDHAGSYPVTLTVTDDGGLTDSSTRMLTVADAVPTAVFITTPASPVAGGTVAFDGTGSADPDGTVEDYAWDFGDGTSGAGPSPTHPYAQAGSYDVVLTVTDDAGLTATARRTLQVAAAPPLAVFTAPTGAAGQSLAFDATSSADPDGSIATYSWDFGDGKTALGPTPGHTFPTAGNYPVTLTVTDGDGLTDSVMHPVTVGSTLPTAVFLPGATAPTVGVPVVFDGSGSTAPGRRLTRYAWTFGDGGTGTGVKPSHTFKAPGSFPVTLMVTDAAGHTASVSHVVIAHWPATDLAVAAGGSAPKAGQYTYRITVKNLGHTGAHGIVLTNALDPTQTLLGAVKAPAGLTCGGVPTGSTGTITCKAPSAVLAAGKSWVVTFTVKQPARTRVRQVTETSAVRAANPDPVTRNNTARLTTAV